jgi:glucokinase
VSGRILAGDIGGTKCLLELADEKGKPIKEQRYDSKAYPDFALVVKEFLKETGVHPERACFAIAGPVVDDKVRTTNLPWMIDARVLEKSLDIPRVHLINDFTAQALAILELGPDDMVELCPGSTVGGGPVAILGAGTGLGEAFLVYNGVRYEVVPSEGGHCDFAPESERQMDLLRYLHAKLDGHVSYERLLSGMGIVNIYSFLRDRRYGIERADVRAAMAAGDPAAAIAKFASAAGAERDGLCDTTMDLFCEIYGQEAGNLALKVLATGGVYVAGGIAAKNIARMQDGSFARGYGDKGRLGNIVRSIPVRCVTNQRSGLIGAAVAATRL